MNIILLTCWIQIQYWLTFLPQFALKAAKKKNIGLFRCWLFLPAVCLFWISTVSLCWGIIQSACACCCTASADFGSFWIIQKRVATETNSRSCIGVQNSVINIMHAECLLLEKMLFPVHFQLVNFSSVKEFYSL